jgi:hypothetical protein
MVITVIDIKMVYHSLICHMLLVWKHVLPDGGWMIAAETCWRQEYLCSSWWLINLYKNNKQLQGRCTILNRLAVVNNDAWRITVLHLSQSVILSFFTGRTSVSSGAFNFSDWVFVMTKIFFTTLSKWESRTFSHRAQNLFSCYQISVCNFRT